MISGSYGVPFVFQVLSIIELKKRVTIADIYASITATTETKIAKHENLNLKNRINRAVKHLQTCGKVSITTEPTQNKTYRLIITLN